MLDPKKTIPYKSNYSNESHAAFLSTEYFHQRIQEEKKRTELIHLQSSLILIDLSFIKSDVKRLRSKEIPIGIIADVIHANTREIDLKGWYDNDKIGIIVPGTSYSGAILLCVTLINIMKKKLRSHLQYTVQLDNYFSVTTYPDFFDDEDLSQKKYSRKYKMTKNNSMNTIARFIQQHKTGFNNNEKKVFPFFPKPLHSSLVSCKQKIVKRLFDIICSLVAIVLALPIFIVVAIAIKLTSSGPVFFKQKRVGLYGKTFTCLKFRSMFVNCDQTIHREHIQKLSNGERTFFETDQSDVLSYKLQNDARITKIGKILRSTSIDELPQLFNVLKGDMSLVGPRPYTAYQVEHCQLWQHLRHFVKPGITGLAQIEARCNATFEDAYVLDIQYIKEYSLWLDFKIFVRTVPFIFSCKGAT